MIIFEQVSKFILSDVSFCVPRGELVGVIGTSGAGKTTLLKLTCGLLAAERGRVYTFRRDPVEGRKRMGRKLAAVFADVPVFGESETVRQSMEDIKNIYGLAQTEFAASYARLGECLGFSAYEKAVVSSLSLGQRRRAELASVFLREPELIVLDEPGIGLDQNAKLALHELLKERKKAGATILISSHDMEEIADLCSRILLLDEGRLIFYGTGELLLKKYAPMDVCELELVPGSKLPNFEDLPIHRYEIQKDQLVIRFNSNHISAAELLSHVMAQTAVLAVNVRKGNLLDSIKNIAGERDEQRDEFYRGHEH